MHYAGLNACPGAVPVRAGREPDCLPARQRMPSPAPFHAAYAPCLWSCPKCRHWPVGLCTSRRRARPCPVTLAVMQGPCQDDLEMRSDSVSTEGSKPPGLRSFGLAYSGRPEQVKRVRADLRAFLNGCPIADETILVASELAANAVIHSSSRQPGGRFIVRAEVCPGDYARVEVEDQGGIWAGHRPRDGRPHGLEIVRAIAGDRSWGIGGDAILGRVAWARLGWPGQ
jgi:serine/threonine-protein kinase RsbW